jgi:CheY-like chemotaxis protein
MTKRSLVVEDQEDLRGVLRDLLTGSGFEVAGAADGLSEPLRERLASSWNDVAASMMADLLVCSRSGRDP